MYYEKNAKFIEFEENFGPDLAEFEYCKYSLSNLASKIRFKNIIPKLKKSYAMENIN